MTYADAIDLLEVRGKRANIAYDALEWLMLLYEGLQELADQWDFAAFTRYSNALFVTSEGVERYQLPHDFGRLLHPKAAQNQTVLSGVRLWDGTSESAELQYEDPALYMSHRSETTGHPSIFTIIGREVWLQPIPDSTTYTGRGMYITTIGRPRMDDIIPLDEPSQLVAHTMGQAVLGPDALIRKAVRAQVVLANNQAKQRQQFNRDSERIGQWRL